MADGLRVAIFGGSFNPPHVAHVLAAAYALSAAPIDEVLVVPVYQHPFAKELAPYDARLEMCRLALELLPRARVSTLERDLGGESLTLRTVEEIARREPAWQLRLLIGSDVLADLPKWHRFDRIAEIAMPLVLGRRGAATTDGALHAGPPLLPPVSSTEIRAAVCAGRLDAVRDLLPTSVAGFIEQRGLYRA
jgi:nicotinate-nucleotide adenylyltransferase